MGGAVWVTPRGCVGYPTRKPGPVPFLPLPPLSPCLPYLPTASRPTSVSNVASGGHANRTGV
ncbi:hypothetical protein GCM10010234_47250 [Streptomyces hawaiiensis]